MTRVSKKEMEVQKEKLKVVRWTNSEKKTKENGKSLNGMEFGKKTSALIMFEKRIKTKYKAEKACAGCEKKT